MDLMLNLISLTPKISAFLVQIRRSYAEGTVIILQCHSKRKTDDVKSVNNDTS